MPSVAEQWKPGTSLGSNTGRWHHGRRRKGILMKNKRAYAIEEMMRNATDEQLLHLRDRSAENGDSEIFDATQVELRRRSRRHKTKSRFRAVFGGSSRRT